ncbi:bifunctional nuclease family protein [candidate division WWE3 bacterium]|uniref:Bifunctional nuclease family protein n=1 Tax=candidate division WWE3 bacterium TaxID=2053526 RepID=A0A7X9DKS6_UNCKA|nr:bifunctional nuclease family protein [candidate division WWE3 bacterium]
MTELKILYVSKSDDSNITYLYDKTNHVLLPVEADNSFSNENFCTVLRSMLNILNVKTASFEIYKHQDETFYWYLRLKTKKQTYKINCDTEIFSYLADKINFPVYAAPKILQKQGIRITEDLLERELET